MSRLPVAALAILLVLPSTQAMAQGPSQPAIEEHSVPWANSRPRDPYVAPDGRVWFVGQVGNYLAAFDPTTEKFERVEIDEGTNPHNQIVDDEGRVWYAGNRNGMIGRYDPATETITRYPMPDPAVRDPHTLTFDGKGHIYFTAQRAGQVGRLDMQSGEVILIPVGERTLPYGIIVDNLGRAFFCQFGTNKISMIDPETLELITYDLPDAGARPRRMALGADGRTIWYVDYARGYLGKLDPSTGRVTEYPSPSGAQARPYAMTSDDQGRLWYVETGPGPNRMIAFDPATERFVANVAVGTADRNAVRHMVFHEPTRKIWYGADANVIGSVDVPVRFDPVP